MLTLKIISLAAVVSFMLAPLMPATTTYACEAQGSASFTLLPPWHKGLPCDGNGNLEPPEGQDGIRKMVLQIIINIVEALLYIAGYVSLGLIIWGGFKYMLYGDNPGGMEGAKKTIQNAVIGLLISIFAVVIINVISGAF